MEVEEVGWREKEWKAGEEGKEGTEEGVVDFGCGC